MKRVIIMRGLPGSGKTKYTEKYSDAWYLSTDLHHMVGGKFFFQQEKLGEYHDKTLRQFINALIEGRELIIVDNTNIRMFEIAPYYRLAEVTRYDVEIIWMMRSVEECIRDNIHGVPEGIIHNMSRSFEPIPPWWKQTIIMR